MSDAIKWALLGVGIVALIALICALPFMSFIDFGEFGSAIDNVVEVAGTAFQGARGLVNNLLSPFGRNVLTGLLFYLLGKFFITTGIKITSWVYHFIFK